MCGTWVCFIYVSKGVILCGQYILGLQVFGGQGHPQVTGWCPGSANDNSNVHHITCDFQNGEIAKLHYLVDFVQLKRIWIKCMK